MTRTIIVGFRRYFLRFYGAAEREKHGGGADGAVISGYSIYVYMFYI